MERNYFVRYQHRAKLHFKNRVALAFFPGVSHLPIKRLGKERNHPLGFRVKVLALLQYHHPAIQSTLPIKIKDSKKSNNSVFVIRHTCVLYLPYLYSPLECSLLELLHYLRPV